MNATGRTYARVSDASTLHRGTYRDVGPPRYRCTACGAIATEVGAAVQQGDRFALAETRVVGGELTFEVPQALNQGYYVGLTLFIDEDDSGSCDESVPTWERTTSPAVGVTVQDITPATCTGPSTDCRRSPAST